MKKELFMMRTMWENRVLKLKTWLYEMVLLFIMEIDRRYYY